MATAVLDLDLQSLPSDITVPDRYDKAFILVRFKGKPIGKTVLPVYNGRIIRDMLHDELLQAVGPTLWTYWLHDYLDWDERNIPGYTSPKATVAVCTRDRPEDLRRCLDALIALPDDGQEILVIDNCPSADETFHIVKDYAGVRYIREDKPGSSAARNRALIEARNEVVAFTDDDATPESGWLRALLRNFYDPRVICVTGQVMPIELENEAQEWFEHYSPLGRGFKRLVFDGANYDRFRVAPIGVSANMALHRRMLDCVGAFDEVLGVGTPSRCGEDHELFSRILGRGYKIVYEPTALSWHRHRRTWKETRKTLHGYGVGVYAFWTRSLLVEREFGVLGLPWGWLFHHQIPNLIRSLLKRPGSLPFDLIFAEFRGCFTGTRAYLISRNRSRRKLKNV